MKQAIGQTLEHGYAHHIQRLMLTGMFGVTAEIAARIAEKAFYHLDAPVGRMGAMDVPVPFSPALEDLTVPTPQAVAAKAAALVRGEVTYGA